MGGDDDRVWSDEEIAWVLREQVKDYLEGFGRRRWPFDREVDVPSELMELEVWMAENGLVDLWVTCHGRTFPMVTVANGWAETVAVRSAGDVREGFKSSTGQ